MLEPLRAGKVHQVQRPLAALLRRGVLANQLQDEDGVGARRACVGLRRRYAAVVLCLSQHRLDLVGRVQAHRLAVDHRGLLACLVVPNLELLLGINLLGRREQIVEFFVVHLDEAPFQRISPGFLSQLADRVVDHVGRPRDHTISRRHSVCLARAGLAVAEDADVVAVEGALNQLRNLPEDVLVLDVRVEDAIKLEGEDSARDLAQTALLLGTRYLNLCRSLQVGEQELGLFSLVGSENRPDSAHDTNVALEFLVLVEQDSPLRLLLDQLLAGLIGQLQCLLQPRFHAGERVRLLLAARFQELNLRAQSAAAVLQRQVRGRHLSNLVLQLALDGLLPVQVRFDLLELHSHVLHVSVLPLQD